MVGDTCVCALSVTGADRHIPAADHTEPPFAPTTQGLRSR